MAVLEDIRKKGGVIVSVIIGLALLAFIVGDFIPRSNGNYDIAVINGKTFTYQQFSKRVDAMLASQPNADERTSDMIRNRVWQMLVSETINMQEYEKIGLSVTRDEFNDMIQGPNPAFSVRQIPAFQNPETGQYDRSLAMRFLNSNDPMRDQFVRELTDERYSYKYMNLVAKALYIPQFMAVEENRNTNRKVDFDYILKPYSSLADSAVTVTQSDIRKYYKAHRNQWEQEASRDIAYVAFDIVPSDEDRKQAAEWIDKRYNEFKQAENPGQYVSMNSQQPFDAKFYKQSGLSPQDALLFDAAEGDMTGPYQDGETLKLSRLAKIEQRPDSIKVRQIVMWPQTQTQDAMRQTVARADSVKKAIEKGADFTALAERYSLDPKVKTNGGDLGWLQYKDVQTGSIADIWFNLKKGEVSLQETQQGIFITQVSDRGKEVKMVQIATLSYTILPSQRTDQIIYSLANRFAEENRTVEACDEASRSLNRRIATNLHENDQQIAGLNSARTVIRWAFGMDNSDRVPPATEVGEVSAGVFKLKGAYVVAWLTAIREKGIAPIEQVSSEIIATLTKQKKAEQMGSALSEAATGAATLGDLATKVSLPVESASSVTFSSFSVPGAGIEPELIATATSSDEGVISKPVDGSAGVFMLSVKNVTETADSASIATARSRAQMMIANRAMSEPAAALRKAAKIEDMRSKFY